MADDSPGTGRSHSRPGVSVIVPFHGSREAATAMLGSLERLDLRDGDEVIVADNTDEGVVIAEIREGAQIRTVPAIQERSAFYARNVAAEHALNGWLLFVDG